ncbi:MAG: sulfur oxidation c-type cytochrome SoxX [Nitrospinae bacterium]|nr:sulfur oxidation c-type cytochrome SoxX [Nitrospinota bacterium]
MGNKVSMFALAAVIACMAALGGAAMAQEKKEAKKEVKLGIEAVKMKNTELFPDIPAPAAKYSEPAGYKGARDNGFKIFTDVNIGNCAACHCADGAKGCGNIGPSLVKYKKELGVDRSHEWTYQKVADARVDNADTVMPPTITTGVLKPEEVADVVAYLESLK